MQFLHGSITKVAQQGLFTLLTLSPYGAIGPLQFALRFKVRRSYMLGCLRTPLGSTNFTVLMPTLRFA
jgi:hypothetical protein